MFTGIVEMIGVISSLNAQDETGGTTLTITSCAPILTDVHLGDSIAVNGTCLTVTSFYNSSSPTTTLNTIPTKAASSSTTPEIDTFTVGVAPETLRRTNLGSLTTNSHVNLERAVSAETRMGGHFVQGHVDTVCTIVDRRADGNAVVLRLRPRDQGVLRYVVEKGYVTLDGASLTVTAVNEGRGNVKAMRGSDDESYGWWEVMLIAYTQERIVTASKKVGDEVNFEADQVGKYVENSVKGYFERAGQDGDEGEIPILRRMVERIVDEHLARKGVNGAGAST